MQKENISIKDNVSLYGVLTALVVVATMVVSIPLSATKGYLNLGDSVVLLSGLILGPTGGFLTGGIGSALADIFLGYAQYAPFTFFVKGLEGACGIFIFNKILKRKYVFPSTIVGGILMAVGYLAVDSILYGFEVAILDFAGNLLQGLAGAIISTILYKTVQKIKK